MILITDGAVIADKYRLQRPLGRGGMGSVWLARHLMLDADVAIKFISAEYLACPDARMRFDREAKISAQLRAPNVAQVYDYGVDDGTPYIVMELLDGEDLASRLLRERRLDPATVLSIVQQICKALRRAHEVGLVHRDLKPANVFHARLGDDEEIVKILDFGIAKMAGIGPPGSVTKAGTMLGSPYYMSPEQVRRSKDVDHRSDLWSLGVITFQCLTGQLPFQGEDLGELILEICAADVLLAVGRAPGLDTGLRSFFSRAFGREPDERFQSAQEFVAAFASAAAFASVENLFDTQQAPAPMPATEVQTPLLVPETFKPSEGTLSPTGDSFVATTRRDRRIGGVLVALATTFVIASLFIAVRSIRGTESDEGMGPSNAIPTPSLDNSSLRETVASLPPSASAVPEALASSTPPKGPPSADAGSIAEPTPRQPPQPAVSSKKSISTSKKPKAKRDDPTNHM